LLAIRAFPSAIDGDTEIGNGYLRGQHPNGGIAGQISYQNQFVVIWH